MYTIYQIINKINGKRYIGYTTQSLVEKRFSQHCSNATAGKSGYLYNAIRKFGSGNFVVGVLCWGDDHRAGLLVAEPLMIEIYKPEYNLTKGGDGTAGYKYTEQQRKARSLQLLGNQYSKGIPRTEEWKRMLSEMRVGNQYTKGYKYDANDVRYESRRISARGKKQTQRHTCPYCLRVGGRAMKRWHFDNCKLKGVSI